NGRGREAGEIPEGFVLDLAVLAIGAPQEVRAIAPPAVRARDLGDVTGPGGAPHAGTLRGEPAGRQDKSWLHRFSIRVISQEGNVSYLTYTLGYIYPTGTDSFRRGNADLPRVLAGELRTSSLSRLPDPQAGLASLRDRSPRPLHVAVLRGLLGAVRGAAWPLAGRHAGGDGVCGRALPSGPCRGSGVCPCDHQRPHRRPRALVRTVVHVVVTSVRLPGV